jgi:hypothetical protein
VYDNPSVLGRNITGRSTAGFDTRYKPINPMILTNGIQNNESSYMMYDTPVSKKLEGWDWGTFVAGLVVGGIVTILLVTSTGRSLVGAAGQRTTRYIRGR